MTDEMREEIRKAERAIMDRLGLMEEANRQHRSEQARVTERLATVLLGEPMINHVGLVATVAEQGVFIAELKRVDVAGTVAAHALYIADQKTAAAETKGEKRVLVFLGGLVGAGVTIIAQWGLPLLLSRGH